MGLVILTSGGLDSTLIAVLAKEQGIVPRPVFIDYGQRSVEFEWRACCAMMKKYDIAIPVRMDLSGYGRAIPSGLTSADLRVNEDAFLPGRNLLFLVAAAAYAYRVGAEAIAIGLLDERAHIFPDQTSVFLQAAAAAVEVALGRPIKIIAPLLDASKAEVIELARSRGIYGTYSCHAGGEEPCGQCISCKEVAAAFGEEG
jgi:7-cyano-7-deazaguanine synthase